MPSKKSAEQKRRLLGDDHSLLVLIAILNVLILFSVLIFGGLGIMSAANNGIQKKYDSRSMMYQRPAMIQRGPQMHPSWDKNIDGINDCEADGTCDHMVDYTQPAPNGETAYTSESWQTMIPASCRSFFDGCNNCVRIADSNGMAACTKKFCAQYEKPVCLDNQQN